MTDDTNAKTPGKLSLLLEGLDVPRPPSILWASLLVLSSAIGLGIFSRRYE